MATPEQQLLGSMNPQLARLLDEQLTGQQAAQGVDQGYQGIVSSAVQGATMLGNIGSDVFGFQRPVGTNEQMVQQAQQTKEQAEKKKEALQAKLSNATPEQLQTIIQNNIVANPTLAKAAEYVLNLRTSPSTASKDFVKTVQLGVNNGTITAESALEAIEAEKNQAGSGRDLLVYTSKNKEKVAEKALSAGDKKRYNTLLDEKNRLQRMNAETSAITSLLDTINPESGALAKVGKAFKTVFGTEDSESVLRARIEAIRVAQAIGNLPPGVASDKDIELVLGGTLPSTANPKALKEWFEALERLNNIAIEEQEAQLAYFDEKSSLKGYFTERREYNKKRAAELTAKRQAELEEAVKAEQARVEAKRAKVKALEKQKQVKNQSINLNAEVGNFQEFL